MEGSISLLSVCNSGLDATGRSCGESTRAYSGCLLCGAPATVPRSLDRQYHQTESRPPQVYLLGDRCSRETESERKVTWDGSVASWRPDNATQPPSSAHDTIKIQTSTPWHDLPRNESARTAGNGAPELVRNEKSRMRSAGWEPRALQLNPQFTSSIPR